MVRRFLALAGLSFGTILVSLLLFSAAASAKALCQCTCFDSSETTTLLRIPKSGTKESEKLASCLDTDKVCLTACTEQKLALSKDDTTYNPNTNRCLCACQKITQTTKYAPLAAGKTECLGDCSTACAGQANVFQDATTPKIVDAPCAPGSDVDCKAGAFSVYEGITCLSQPTTEQGWPNNQKPACIVPLTLKNANKECANYGGLAKGGACGEIASGENPNSYFKARPILNQDGTYGVTNYPGPYGSQTQAPYPAWKQTMDAENPTLKPIKSGSGICYRLGAVYGSVPAYKEFGPEEEQTQGGIPSNAFVCLKKKSNTCGKLDPPSNLAVPGKASFYTCQRDTDYLAQFTNKDQNFLTQTCFPLIGSDGKGNDYQDLCVTYPPGAGYRCCPSKGKTGGCLTDKDCSLDNSKVCYWPDCTQTDQIGLQACKAKHALTFDTGTCVWNTVCDLQHNDAVDTNSDAWKNTPWTFDVRRCRVAAPTEVIDQSICSPESGLPSAPKRCPKAGEACCLSKNTKAISSCAADKSYNQGPASFWNDFACISINGIPKSEYVTMPNGQQQLVAFNETNPQQPKPKTPGSCLTSELQIKIGGVTTGAKPRCPTGGQYCCYTPGIASNGGVDNKANLQAGWAYPPSDPCPSAKAGGPLKGFKCLEKKVLGGATDAFANEHGFSSLDAYFQALAASNNCKVTPVESDIFYNKECANNPDPAKDPNAKLLLTPSLCCSDALLTATFCETDEACLKPDGYKSLDECKTKNPTELSKCKVCDPSLKLCVDSGLYAQNMASDSCFTRAQAQGEPSAQEIANANKTDPKVFACQAVFSETPGVFEKCLQQGCGQLPPPGDGSSFKCCIPGIGQSAFAAAKAGEAKKAAAAPSAPFTLGLPSCIADGKCSLDQIVSAGANFANFLIGISGSVFLAIFVYGGFMYLTAGSSERVGKAKKMILQSVFAMVLILGAYVFISFIQSSIVGGATGAKGPAKCGKTEDTKNFACTFLKAPVGDKKAMDAEVQERSCKRGQCAGPDNFVCCPT